jgi:DnaJ-domain-containing protein 1
VSPTANDNPSRPPQFSGQNRFTHSYYGVLELYPSATPLDIRRAYRELSKRYHPDTTLLAADIATVRFQRLNEAYATLSNPDRRAIYDLQIGYSRWNVIQAPEESVAKIASDKFGGRSAYLDPSDRPLSAGEIFALGLLGLTLFGCLGLAVLIAWLRGDPLIIPALFPNGA